MAHAAFCLTSTETQALQVLHGLRAEGWVDNDVAVLLRALPQANDEVQSGVGGPLAVLTGIGAVTVPEVGTLIAAGPMRTWFDGRRGQTLVGGLIGGLWSLGVPDFLARLYDHRLGRGQVLVAAYSNDPNRLRKAKQVYVESGAREIHSNERETHRGTPYEGDRAF